MQLLKHTLTGTILSVVSTSKTGVIHAVILSSATKGIKVGALNKLHVNAIKAGLYTVIK